MDEPKVPLAAVVPKLRLRAGFGELKSTIVLPRIVSSPVVGITQVDPLKRPVPPLAEMNHVTGGSLGSGPVKIKPWGPLPIVTELFDSEDSPPLAPTLEFSNTGLPDEVPAT